MRLQENKNRKSKKPLVVSVLIIVLAAAIVSTIYLYVHRNDIKRDSNGVSIERTPQDKKLEQDLNKNPEKKEESTQTDQPPKPSVDPSTKLQKVNVVLTNVGESEDASISASGFVSNIVETNGVCTYQFTSAGRVIEKQSTILPSASSTTCKTINFPASELGSGVWKVQLKYTSSVSEGISNTLEVNVK